MSDAFELVWIYHSRFSSQIFSVCGGSIGQKDSHEAGDDHH